MGGVAAYVATPTGEYAKDKVILFLSDVFGFNIVNSKVCITGTPCSLSELTPAI